MVSIILTGVDVGLLFPVTDAVDGQLEQRLDVGEQRFDRVLVSDESGSGGGGGGLVRGRELRLQWVSTRRRHRGAAEYR